MSTADFFLKIDGIPGESEDEKLKDTIELLSWSWGMSNSGSAGHGGGMGSGKVALNDFHFTMKLNKAAHLLQAACAGGKHIPKAELICRKATGDKQDTYLKYTFTDMIISSYQTGGADGSGNYPTEAVSFNFTKYEMEYYKQDKQGIMAKAGSAGWDVKKNMKV